MTIWNKHDPNVYWLEKQCLLHFQNYVCTAMHVVPSSTLCLLNLYATLERRDCHQTCIFGKRWSISPISKASNLKLWACASIVALEGHGDCHAKFSWRPTYTVQHCPHFVLSINQAQMVSTQPLECPRESQKARSHAMLAL